MSLPAFANITPLQLEAAISWFFAVGIGALIARESFIGPALLLSVISWGVGSYFIHDITGYSGPNSFSEVLAQRWVGLVLISFAAVSGAVLGRWFYKREIKNVAGAP